MLQALIGVLPAVAGMFAGNGQDQQIEAQLQAQKLQSATQMATEANQGVRETSAMAQQAYQQSGLGRQQALSSVVDGFRNALLRGVR